MERKPDQPWVMTKKEALLKELEEEIRNNVDFISLETYKSIFSKFNLKDAKILDVGAGFIPIVPQATQYMDALPIKRFDFGAS